MKTILLLALLTLLAPALSVAAPTVASAPASGAVTAAAALGAAKDLAGARKAFATLSGAMIAWHATRPKDDRVVVYCPMVKESWLQPKGEIGNPYYGQSMAKCGEVVSK